jgi:ATP-dependent Clp protease ATP-binding subunit ClpC
VTETHVKETLESAIRRISRELTTRYEDDPERDALEADEDFRRAVRLLAADDVPVEDLERLAKGRPAVLSCIAIAALMAHETVRQEWIDWAIGRLRRASLLEADFLLQAIAERAAKPVIAAVLCEADDSWEYREMPPLVTRFIERRLALGEQVEAEHFEKHALQAREDEIETLLKGLDLMPREIMGALDAWSRNLVDLDFFRGLGTVYETPPEGATTLVGTRASAVEAIIAAVSSTPKRSVILVAEHGVGKTSVAHEAIRRLTSSGWIAFEAGAATVIAGQTFTGQLEGRVADIVRRAEGRPVLWLFPNLNEALWAGQHTRSPHGVLDLLLPHIETGRLVLVAEVDPSAYETVLQQRPRVATAFETVRLPPLGADDALHVARDALKEAKINAPPDETLHEASDLAGHYLSGVAAPGGLLRLLKATHEQVRRRGGTTMKPDDLLDTLSKASGLPLHVLDPRAALDLEAVREFFSQRVLGQPEAVDCLVERIAMIKAGLTDPTRPLGVFLFVGPTGTGKTEIAKALAEFLFGSSERLVRLDMSEYKTAESFERLLADASDDPRHRSLISAVSREPFSVVLLDEFERAHPNIWDLFLQVFDDGRLTGQSGGTADFRHCVVILTSNIGSVIPAEVGPGFVSRMGNFREEAVERAVRQSFRPELVNRLDRIIFFRPLKREQMRVLLHHELAGVLGRRGLRMQPWAVEWDEAAIDFLLEQGFSHELGARPLKRAVERYLLAPLALAIVERQFPEGDQFLLISARNGKALDVAFIDPDEEADEAAPISKGGPVSLKSLVGGGEGTEAEVEYLRAEIERLRTVLGSDEWRTRKDDALEATTDPGLWDTEERFEVLGHAEYLDRIDAAMRTAEGLLVRLSARHEQGSPAGRLVTLLAQRLYLLDRAVTGIDAGVPPDAYLDVRPDSSDDEGAAKDFARRLLAMYRGWAERRGMRVQELDGGLLAISGLGASTILGPEAGRHVLEVPRSEGAQSFERVIAEVRVVPRPPGPAGLDGDPVADVHAALEAVPATTTTVRRYREEPSPLVRDAVRKWRTGRLDRVLAGDFDVVV